MTGRSLDSYSKKVIGLINKIRDIGVSKQFDLPTIVFCGKQSAGKSSLIEAISKISLPRNKETCTRMPIDLRMTSGDCEWNCTVKIRYEEEIGIRTPEHVENEQGVVLYDPEDVCETVAAYQDKLVGPGCASKFSKNVICVEIMGRDVGDLALIDLPGLIETTESKQDRGYITLIEELVRYYITKENAIVAMVISCNEDLESQSIKTLVDEIDPTGERTVGILTKLDRIEDNCHQRYVEVLHGEIFSLKLGYFAVRNPSQVELEADISWEQARRNESKFFETEAPWKFLDRNFVGSENLVNFLGKLLVGRISKQLPLLKKEMEEKYTEVQSQLRSISKNSGQMTKGSLLMKLNELVSKLESHVNGDKDHRIHFKTYRKIQSEFVANIRSTCPQFKVPMHKNASDYSFKKDMLFNQLCFSYIEGTSQEELVEILEDNRGRDLTSFAKFDPVKTLIQEFIKKWSFPALNCLESVRQYFEAVIVEQVKIFENYPLLKERVLNYVASVLTDKNDEARAKLAETFEIELDHPFTLDAERLDSYIKRIDSLLKRHFSIVEILTEADKSAGGLNGFFTTFSKNKRNQQGNQSRTKQFSPTAEPNLTEEQIKTLQTLSQESDSTVFAKHITEKQSQVIRMMSTSLAYFQISSVRYQDNVSMAIDISLKKRFLEKVQQGLVIDLKIFELENDEFNELVAEDAKIEKMRKSLLYSESHIREACNEITRFLLTNSQ